MHPLNIQLEELAKHDARPRLKRRATLDNSSLKAIESARLIYDADDVENGEKPRRLSLNHDIRISVSFLASGHLKRTHEDLDKDCHKSHHGRKSSHGREKTRLSSTGATEAMSEEEWSMSDDDDCDSFCDGSVQDQPNKEYLRRDLGASCIWDDSMSDCDLVETIEDLSLDSFPEAIAEADEDGGDDERSPTTSNTPNSSSSTVTGTSTRRVKRRSFTKKIPRVLFRSKSPKVHIRKKKAARDD